MTPRSRAPLNSELLVIANTLYWVTAFWNGVPVDVETAVPVLAETARTAPGTCDALDAMQTRLNPLSSALPVNPALENVALVVLPEVASQYQTAITDVVSGTTGSGVTGVSVEPAPPAYAEMIPDCPCPVPATTVNGVLFRATDEATKFPVVIVAPFTVAVPALANVIFPDPSVATDITDRYNGIGVSDVGNVSPARPFRAINGM